MSNDLRLPNPAWAWEYLRRNKDYQRDFRAIEHKRAVPTRLQTGCLLRREDRQWPKAEKWGLLTFANPSKPAQFADVFWRTDLLAGALSVKLYPIEEGQMQSGIDQDEIILSKIQTRRVALRTANGTMHLLIGGRRFWIHLYCKDAAIMSDKVRVGVQIDGMKHFRRRLDTAAQLLSLYQSSGKKLSLIGRNKSSKRLANGLIAFDIIADGGTHRDVAIGVYGYETVAENWGQSGAYLEDNIRRLIYRANHLVDAGYRDFLTKKDV